MKPQSEMPVAHALNVSRAYMDDHFRDPLDIAEISGRAHFSRYHFSRLFRRAFHETPHQYLTRKRIEKAKELLANSDLSVTGICFAVGFESLGSFSALFRRTVGWAPSAYRARVFEQRRINQKFIPHCFIVMHGLRPMPQLSTFKEVRARELCDGVDDGGKKR